MTSSLEFLRTDFLATLFPLKTNRLLASIHGKEISDYIYQRVLNDQYPGDCFLSQQRVFATKPKGHLRRTVKLDPVAEFFIYDLCYRNRAIFRPEVSETRRSFGYRFKDGKQIPVHVAYAEYKNTLKACSDKYKHNVRFDIASYFNSVYHHDICHWFASKDVVSNVDGAALNQFFREINAGRSIDFLPQGIYPCKMLGNEFLKFVDLSGMLKSATIVRFMDDFTLFDDNAVVLRQDFVRIQQLLGQFALNINPSKTLFDQNVGDVQEQLSEIKESLTAIIVDYEEVPIGSGVELIETVNEVEYHLNKNQVQGLLALLRNDSLEESDADLILGFLRTHSESILEPLAIVLEKFPNLIKHVYVVCADIPDKKSLAATLLAFLNSGNQLLEYQLFWMGSIVEDYLLDTPSCGELLVKLYERTNDMKIARAKILEIPVQAFGFKELRDEYLKTGQSDWLSWSSAIGSRTLKAAERNYVLDYFSKSSPMNFLIASGVKKMDASGSA